MNEGERSRIPDSIRRRRRARTNVASDAQRGRRGRIIKGVVKYTPPAVLAAVAADRGLDRDQANFERTTRENAVLAREMESRASENERDARTREAIARAQASVEAGEPAPQSGVIDVSEEGITGYVDLDSGDPEATTTVDSSQMGGVSAEAESDTGGVAPDSTS